MGKKLHKLIPFMQAIHDWKLAIGVLILVIIDVTILTIYTIANRNNLLAIPLDDRTHPEDSGGENNVKFIYFFFNLMHVVLQVYFGQAKQAPTMGFSSRFCVIYIYSMYIYMNVELSTGKPYKKCVCHNAWAELCGPNICILKVNFGQLKLTYDTYIIHFYNMLVQLIKDEKVIFI